MDDRYPFDSAQGRRIDLWLKRVCLFKHRSDATDACKGGHVKINGQSVKPAAQVREGDVVELTIGDHYRKVVVQGLPEGNISKETARTMYIDETPVREKVARDFGVVRERGSGRPTKKERREIDKMRR